MKNNLSLTITHLYPKIMNIYGDKGNVIALNKRCEWRGIKVRNLSVGITDDLPQNTDIYFMGGGQDEDQVAITESFLRKKEELKDQIEDGVSLLAICGPYQLLGKFFLTGDRRKIPGLGILDIETRAPDENVKSRCIGNIVAKLNPEVFDTGGMELSTIVGYENHSGHTFLGKNMIPLGFTIKGFGNNAKDDTAGCIYKNVLGTYFHGPFLPKNPHIADFIILNALRRKYGDVELEKLDDREEIAAHKFILENK